MRLLKNVLYIQIMFYTDAYKCSTKKQGSRDSVFKRPVVSSFSIVVCSTADTQRRPPTSTSQEYTLTVRSKTAGGRVG